MIDFLIGDVVAIEDEYVVIQNNNVGYRVYTSVNSMLDMEIGQKNVMLSTNLIVREDAILLYGFTSEEEVDMFNMLLRVSRIGPKVAIGVLSTLSPNKIKRAILTDDVDVLTEAPGIGKKTGERMILELKDRIDESELIIGEEKVIDKSRAIEIEAVDALVGLGYTKYEAETLIRKIDTDEMDVEGIIRVALKEISK